MVEYIKIDKNTFPTPYTINVSDYARGWNTCLNSVLQHRTTDVVEVKHGKWLITDTFDHHKIPIYRCSICNKEVADHYINLHKHCLHCGAEMNTED